MDRGKWSGGVNAEDDQTIISQLLLKLVEIGTLWLR